MQFDLLFERFLNPERISMPDIDIDFCFRNRERVIDYVTGKYGRPNVAQIITFGTMAARAVLRDAGRGLDIPYAEVDKIAKLVPQQPGQDITIAKALAEVDALKQAYQSDPRVKELIDVGQRLEGLVRHASTHAAGVVIAPKPIVEFAPLYRGTDDAITTQFAMADIEEIGLLKMDFLGLKTLTLIDDALASIASVTGSRPDLETLLLDDPAIYDLFAKARTAGVFQFESEGMRNILRRLKPDRFEDLVAINALYRPGPIGGGLIDDFIKRRHGKVKVEYPHPLLEAILKETYGVIVYQEQVMQIASAMAGYSLGEADILRRAMGKKKKEAMAAEREKFIERATTQGVAAGDAGRVFDQMEFFAGYGFNKSHSAAYALVAYRTAWLKAHYPVHFMAALLTTEKGNTEKLVQYVNECKEMGIPVLPPDVNTSSLDFTVFGDHVRFGKGLGTRRLVVSISPSRGSACASDSRRSRTSARVRSSRSSTPVVVLRVRSARSSIWQGRSTCAWRTSASSKRWRVRARSMRSARVAARSTRPWMRRWNGAKNAAPTVSRAKATCSAAVPPFVTPPTCLRCSPTFRIGTSVRGWPTRRPRSGFT